MKQCSLFNIFCIVFLTFVGVQLSNNASLDIQDKTTEDQGLYNHKDDVKILTADNFKDSIMGSNKAWLVEFYNSWCGFCQRFAPSWKEFATDVKAWSDLVVVAAIDCSNDKNYGLCRDYEVMAYPTLRYYSEGFQEEPKNYGFQMNRGVTATDHRNDLVSKILNEQSEGRGKQFPNLSVFIEQNLNNIFTDAPSETKYALLIVTEPGSLLGPELVLDFHKASNLITRYAQSNNTELVSFLPKASLPSLYIIGRDKLPTLVIPNSPDRKGMVEAVQENLNGKGVIFSKESVKTEELVKEKEDNILGQRVKKMGDVVFQMDLESALRYSLKREVSSSKEISGEKLEALRKYLQVLAKYFPFGRNGKVFLQEISNYAQSDDVIQGINIGKMVKDAEKEERMIFSTPQKWLGCQGSTPLYRGYPCGLWTLFHYLTVNVADYEAGLGHGNPRLALETMHGYIKNFFSCSDCSEHFQEMAARREIGKVGSFNDSILWLWNAHNEVNKRLSGDVTEDPEYPKVQFPSKERCPKCHKQPDGSWDSNEVLKYLKHMYSSVNIGYLGADTKVLYLLGGNTTSDARLQKEAVQVQARPIGQSLANKMPSDGLPSSGAMTKDKAVFILTLSFIVLTVSCV